MSGGGKIQLVLKECNDLNSLASSSDLGKSPYPSREDILAIYDEGPEAVVTLVTELAMQIAELEERVRSLEIRLNKDSSNSSKPPSTDPPTTRPRSQRKKSDRPVGGQKGHTGHTLKMVDNPDHVVEHQVSICDGCGMSLVDVQATGCERRQVFDLPPKITVEVTEHQAETKTCPTCGHLNQATFPDKVQQPVQYGPNLKSVATYLNQYQLIPYDRLRVLFIDLFHCELSQATLVNTNRACYKILGPVEKEIKQQLIDSPVAHFDETGMRIEGKRKWCHVVCTKTLTHYAAHDRRGSEANKAMGILPAFKGIAVHDGWKPYFKFDCLHALCNAHHLRELIGIQVLDEQQTWANNMIDLLLEIKNTGDERRSRGRWLKPSEIKRFEGRYDRIILKGMLENPPPVTSTTQNQPKKRGRKKQTAAKNLLDRFSIYRQEVLAFMYDPEVPFDNNLAERDIRMMKVQQKISGTFRSWLGADTFCRIRGYISTARKNSISVIDAIRGALEGRPYIPPLVSS